MLYSKIWMQPARRLTVRAVLTDYSLDSQTQGITSRIRYTRQTCEISSKTLCDRNKPSGLRTFSIRAAVREPSTRMALGALEKQVH